ncbi:MAG: hypothetical protein LLG06_06455, partial [Desulfobacteraceae bacterium]|nr:hypothetical protein [Desulfobacteraceae bacterium]
APEEAFATGMATLSGMLADRVGQLKAKALELRKEALTSFEVYKTKTREIQEVLDAGLISQEQATANFAKAWNEYYKDYPKEKLQEEVNLAKEAYRVKQSLIEREMGALDASFNQGQISAADYYSGMTNLARQSSAERIALLQREASGVEQILKVELENPLKTPLEKDLLKTQAQTKIQQINAEVAEVQTGLAKSLNAFAMEYLEKAKSVVDIETRALQEVYENTVTSFDARAEAGQRYLEKRLQQIEFERQANIRAGMPGAVAGELATTQAQEAQRKVLVDQLTQRATLAQLNVQYAELTGNMETQLRTQIALIQATKDRNVAEAKTPEIAEAYRRIAEEQERIANLRAAGSFWDGLNEGARRFRNSLPTIADEGINAFKALESGISSAADTLAEFTLTGKANFSDFANSIMRDILRMVYTSMLNRTVGALLDGIFGSLSFGSGKSFTSAGGATWSTGMNFLEHHSGGMAGSSTVQRFLPEGLLAFAPRLHSGLAPDEIPAILQTGERVLNRKEAAEYERSAPEVSVIIHNNTANGPTKTTEKPMRFNGRRWVKEITIDLMNTDDDFRHQFAGLIPR